LQAFVENGKIAKIHQIAIFRKSFQEVITLLNTEIC